MDAKNMNHQSHMVIWLGSKKQSQSSVGNHSNHINCHQGDISQSVLDTQRLDTVNVLANDGDFPEKDRAAMSECENNRAETQAADHFFLPTTTALDEDHHHLDEDDNGSPAAQPSHQRLTSMIAAPALPSPTSAQIQLSRSPMMQQPLLSAEEPAELHQTGVMDAREIQRLRVGDFVVVNPSSCSEFWIAQVRECFLPMNTLEVVWWTRFRRDGKSLIRRDNRVYRRDDGHHSSLISVATVFGILEDYELACSENATSFMKNSKNDRDLKEEHKKGDEDNESTKHALLIIGEEELERLRCMAEKHGMHCAKACRRRVRATSKGGLQRPQLNSESSDESSSDRNCNNKIEERDASTRKRPRVSQTSQAAFTNTCQMSNPMESHFTRNRVVRRKAAQHISSAVLFGRPNWMADSNYRRSSHGSGRAVVQGSFKNLRMILKFARKIYLYHFFFIFFFCS